MSPGQSCPSQAVGATLGLAVQTTAGLEPDRPTQTSGAPRGAGLPSSSLPPGLRLLASAHGPFSGPPWDRGRGGRLQSCFCTGARASTSPTTSAGEAMWSSNKAPLRAADGAGRPGTPRGWLRGPGPTKASLSHRRPPAEPEVAVAPGACHLMTVLAGPDVPQTPATAVQGRSASQHHRGHSNSN